MSLAMPSSGTRLVDQVAALRRLVHRFLSWWFGELASCLPAALRRRWSGARHAVVLTIDAEHASLWHEGGAAPRLLDRYAVADLERHDASRRTTAFADRLRRGNATLRLRLAAASALRTRVSLPLAAEANLRRVLEFELDRRTPYAADAAYFTHRVLRRDAARRQIEVELTVVPRPVVAAALARAERLGVRPRAVEVAGDGPGDAASGNLLTDAATARRRPLSRALRAAAGLALVLLATSPAIALYESHRQVEALRHEVAKAKQLAERAARTREAIAKLGHAERFLAERRRAATHATEVLHELTRILPDDTWLAELGLGRGELRFSGFSASASTLIELLDRSSLLREPKFRAAVTLDPAAGRERFEIGAKLVAKVAP